MGLLSITERLKDNISLESSKVSDVCISDLMIKEHNLNVIEIKKKIICPVLKIKFCCYNNCRYWTGKRCGNLS